MEYVIDILYGFTPYTPYVAFGLLILAGLNLPVSEDIVFIISASIAATVEPEDTALIFAGCFLGAYLSDIMAYCIGRFAGEYVLDEKRKWTNRFVSKKKLDKVRYYFLRHGQKTLFIGRFIPFGVRNVLFMTSGMVRMPINRFLAIDLAALTLTSSVLFSLGYTFGRHYHVVISWVTTYKYVIFSAFAIAVVTAVVVYASRRQKRTVDR